MGRFSRVRCSPLPVLFFRGDGGEEGVRKGQVRQRAPRGVVSVGGPEEGPRCPPTSRRTAAPYPILKSRSFGHDKPTVRIFIICNLRREIRLVKPTTWRLEYTHDVYRVPHRFFHFERGKSSSGFHSYPERERERCHDLFPLRSFASKRLLPARKLSVLCSKEWRTRRFFLFFFRNPGRTKIDRLGVRQRG